MADDIVSRRGVYRDLSLSPYEYTNPYGDLFKFSSAKKMEIYTRDIPKEMHRLDKLVERHDLAHLLPEDTLHQLRRAVYRSFYRQVER